MGFMVSFPTTRSIPCIDFFYCYRAFIGKETCRIGHSNKIASFLIVCICPVEAGRSVSWLRLQTSYSIRLVQYCRGNRRPSSGTIISYGQSLVSILTKPWLNCRADIRGYPFGYLPEYPLECLCRIIRTTTCIHSKFRALIFLTPWSICGYRCYGFRSTVYYGYLSVIAQIMRHGHL